MPVNGYFVFGYMITYIERPTAIIMSYSIQNHSFSVFFTEIMSPTLSDRDKQGGRDKLRPAALPTGLSRQLSLN